eukprot:TRINITY_DN67529_c3_g3_i2.p1 TRINITY_DN67529_c3_g3~~TRINITY_DN67529_c3_g3_i2.p1  ORF type:complete len:135 (+),score=20.13 TRINITY_DN67529_c3_g3_i2:57-461(+)
MTARQSITPLDTTLKEPVPQEARFSNAGEEGRAQGECITTTCGALPQIIPKMKRQALPKEKMRDLKRKPATQEIAYEFDVEGMKDSIDQVLMTISPAEWDQIGPIPTVANWTQEQAEGFAKKMNDVLSKKEQPN